MQISAGRTRRDAQATAERDHAVGLATDHKDWVHAVGGIHVTLAADAKAAADALAGSLKTASDGLTADQAAAANGLAEDLATAEADYASGTATANANHGDAAAGPDGTLEIGLTAVANLLREGIVRERGEYETESYAQHAAAIVAPSSTALIAPGGEGGLSGPLADLIAYQRAVAQHDLTWSQGAATAKNNFESALSAEYLAHATAEHGLLGSVPTHIHAAGEAVKNQVIGIANADKTLSIASTGNLADFTVDAQSAASKAAKSGVAAEGAYDLARAQAKRDYNNAVADAGLIQTTAVQDADLAYTLATPYPLPENWESTTEAQDLLATRDAAHLAAATIHTNSLKAARLAHATAIGAAQVTRAEQLGDALIAEATETGNAEIGFVTAQSSTEQAFEGDVTLKEVAGTTGIVAGDGVYKNSHQTNDRNLTAGVGAALVQFAIDMKPVNVNHTAGIVAAEGVYHTATASRIASRHTAYAGGFPAVSPQGFNAAQANAESQWIASMAPAAAAYATAVATAEADEGIALAQATVAYENARADADVSRVSADQPLNATRAIGSTSAWHAYAEDNAGDMATRNGSLATAHKTYDVADATAIRGQAVAYATASKTYWVEYFTQGEPSLPPDWWLNPLELARKVAEAEADLDYAEAIGNAEVDWTADINEAERIYASAKATGLKSLESQTALLQKQQIVAGGGPIETQHSAYVAAETNLWLAEATAANNRRTAEDTALADFRGADYGAKATAIADIDTALDLPWTEYLAGKAAAESSWWTNSERGNFLALSAATNAADLAYETVVIAAYTTWAAQTIAAQRAYADAQAEQSRLEKNARAAADETYTITFATSAEIWSNGRATNLKNRRNDFNSDRRDAIAAGDTTFVQTWELITIMPDPADTPVDRAFDVSVFLADGQRTVSEIVARQGKVAGLNPAETAYFTATANADEGYTIAESNAAAARGATIATAIADHDVTEAAAYDAALESLATATPSPWADYDAAVADATSDYMAVVSPAARDAVIAELYADRDFAQTMAVAERAAVLSLASIRQTRDVTVVNAAVTRAQTQLQAQTTAAASPTVPLGNLNAIEEAPQQPAGGGADTGDAPPADPNAPKKAETFEEILIKFQKKWNLPPEKLLEQFFAGVKEGFFDGLKDTFTLVTTWGEYGFYLSLSGQVLRSAQIKAGFGDPIAEQEAAVSAFGQMLHSYAVDAIVDGSDLWENREELAVAFATQAAGLYVKVNRLRVDAGKWLEANQGELLEAILSGDVDKLERLKKGLDPQLQAAIDMMYATAVTVVDMAAEQIDAHKLGYVVGMLLYEACEDAVISGAWALATGGTAGGAGAAAPAIVAARVANFSRKLENVKDKIGISPELMRSIIDKAQEAIWWAMKWIEMCFVAGTPVLTAVGRKAIEEIVPGDMVYSRPENDPTTAPRLKQVVRTVVTHPTRLYHISYEASDHREETLSGTGEHPFFVVGSGRFVPAKELSPGDEFILADGSSAWVTKIEIEDAAPGEHFTTYNFEVEDDHTYHVGELGVWVHNKGEFCQEVAERLAKHAKLPDDELRKLIRKEIEAEYEKIKAAAKKSGTKIPKFSASERLKHENDILHRLGRPAVTGQVHHPISTPVGKAIADHKTLAGKYKNRDPRFLTQAVDDAAHNGYETWHRQLDEQVVEWLERNKRATQEQFEAWLRSRYGEEDLLKRFPYGF